MGPPPGSPDAATVLSAAGITGTAISGKRAGVEDPTVLLSKSQGQGQSRSEPELLTHREFDDDFTSTPAAGYSDDDGPDDEPTTEEEQRMRRKKIWRRVRRTCYVLLALGIIGPVLAFFITYQMVEVEDPSAVAEGQDKVVTVQYADGSEMASLAKSGGNRIMLQYDQIPDPIKKAVFAAEDATFETNSGFDLTGIARAVFANVTGGQGGGSTISQQYIKKASGNDDPTLSRKWVEVVKSYKMTKTYEKNDIITAYLNTIYFGRGAYGVAAASKAYFDVDISEVTPTQAALLAGMIQTPSRGSHDAEYHHQRWDYVSNRMISLGWWSAGEKANNPFPAPIPYTGVSSLGSLPGPRRVVIDRVYDELKDRYGLEEEDIKRDGYVIQLTIDKKAQELAEQAVAEVMEGQPANLMPGLVAVDPKTGEIRAYYGAAQAGFDYANAVQEPGSAFKPFDLVGLLQKGKGLNEVYDTTPKSFGDDEKTVRNASTPRCGRSCTVAEAMKESLNVVFSDMVYNDVKPVNVAKAAEQAGIRSDLSKASNDINIAIGGGATQVKTTEMASAYATFAANGTYRAPHLVAKVTYPDGGVRIDAKTQPDLAEKPAFDAEDPERNQKIARNVTESLLPIPAYSKIPCADNRKCAGKTGTHQYQDTEDNSKAWMVGYTPQMSTAVSMGGDKTSQILRNAEGKPIYGSGLPGEIWKKFMDSYHEGLPKEDFGKYVPMGKVSSKPTKTNGNGNDSDNDNNRPSSTQTSTPELTTPPSVPKPPSTEPEEPPASTTSTTRTRPPGGGDDDGPGFPFPGNGPGGGNGGGQAGG
ncbi:transglycosylase domain-containing protein [Actinokineospora pegani]|uniref:transglycosylase domain-containing protein n=1 Tax=Actinokineospora pegani TaxID=2654637 RepID=UPI0012EA6152|nr:transglycosylase domain-containing protein [Actinokineospora pegani]